MIVGNDNTRWMGRLKLTLDTVVKKRYDWIESQ